jgi:hypothetical protein
MVPDVGRRYWTRYGDRVDFRIAHNGCDIPTWRWAPWTGVVRAKPIAASVERTRPIMGYVRVRKRFRIRITWAG